MYNIPRVLRYDILPVQVSLSINVSLGRLIGTQSSSENQAKCYWKGIPCSLDVQTHALYLTLLWINAIVSSTVID